jgi:hypothetical protein
MYFAVEQSDGEAAIWALDRTVIDSPVRRLLPSDTCNRCVDETGYIDTRKCFAEVFDRTPRIPLVSPVTDDVAFFFGPQRLYLRRHILRAFDEARKNLAAVL